ncbi:TPA: hypothetical protein ACT2IF_001977 [Streptococcus suis]
MLGELSIMDLVTIGGLITAIAGVLGSAAALWRLFRDTKALSKEHQSIQEDTTYISDEMRDEKRAREGLYQDTRYISTQMIREETARQELYKNSSRAKEILETMDMMKEVVLQNAQLNAENSVLKQQNHELLFKDNQEQEKLFQAITAFERRLSGLEGYKETEEIRSILKSIERQLLEHVE